MTPHRRLSRFPAAFVVLLSAFALLASACSSGSQPSAAPPLPEELPLLESGEDTPTDPAVATDDQTNPTAEESAGDLPTMLRVAVVGTPDPDPAAAAPSDPGAMMFVDLLYDGLTAWDPQNGTWELALAASVSANEDSSVWTFTLHEGLTFSDGSSLTADDVERSIERVLADSDGLGALRLDMVSGVGERDDVSGVTALDELTVEIILDRPYSGLPAALSSPVFGVVPGGDIAGGVTSGPLVSKGWRGGALWLQPVVPTAENFGVMVSVVDDADAAQQAFDEGLVDIAPAAQVDGSTVQYDRDVQIHYVMNVSSWKLMEPAFRLAITRAVDRSGIAADVYDDMALPLGGLTPGSAACDDSCAPALEEIDFLLDQAFDGGGMPPIHVDYVVDQSGTEAALADELVRQLTAAGIDAQAREHTLLEFVELVQAGEHEIYRSGWVGLDPSAESRLSPYLSGSADNTSGYENEMFDTFVATGRSLFDGSVMYENAWKQLEQDAVVLPLVSMVAPVNVAPRVEGLEFRHDGSFSLDGVTLTN